MSRNVCCERSVQMNQCDCVLCSYQNFSEVFVYVFPSWSQTEFLFILFYFYFLDFFRYKWQSATQGRPNTLLHLRAGFSILSGRSCVAPGGTWLLDSGNTARHAVPEGQYWCYHRSPKFDFSWLLSLKKWKNKQKTLHSIVYYHFFCIPMFTLSLLSFRHQT